MEPYGDPMEITDPPGVPVLGDFGPGREVILPGHHGDPQPPNPASLLWAPHGCWSGSCHLIPSSCKSVPAQALS